MAERAAALPAELAGRAAPGPAGRAGGHRQPARSGGGLRRRRAACSTSNRAAEERAAAVAWRAAARAGRRTRRSSARCWSGCARTCWAARAPYLPRGYEEAVRVARAGGRPVASCRAASPVYGEGGRRGGGHGRAPGRDAAAPLRRAEERPGRHGGARVPHAAHLAAHGHPPVRRGRGGPAHREAGRPAVRGARGLRAAAGHRG